MENYFQMNLSKAEIDAISNLGLAHMGDCVFEILCRGWLCARGGKNVGNLHRDTINMVKASSQAKFAEKLLPLLARPLADDGIVLFEHGKDEPLHDRVGGLVKKKDYRYGKIYVTSYVKEDAAEE